ncbi:MAG: HlyD family efflux transporter periplasmic adaptor subunit [Nitriliruptoraceae bacterium]|nr:HlyD family efflux transporter periplasmic adaptor subunit [Nitriliruptoraceae bacterium]
MRRVAPAVVLAAALVLAACQADEQPVVETAEVVRAEVVQTVAASARLAPRAMATAVAPFGAEVEDILVADGDVVSAGDPLLRLAGDPIEGRIARAEEALAAAEELGDLAAGAGVDLAPTLGAFRSQLDTTLPGLIGTLEQQAQATSSALGAAIAGVTDTAAAGDELADALAAAVEDVDPDDLADLADAAELAGVDGVDVDALLAAQEALAAAPVGPDVDGVLGNLIEAQQAADAAQRQLAGTRAQFAEASRQLAAAEQDLSASTDATEAAQRAAVEAQVAQAEQALQAAEAQLEERTVVAPIGGTVEFIRDGGGGAGGGLDALGGLGDLGGLADGLGGLGDLGDLAPPANAGGGGARAGALEVGTAVSAGEPLVRVYDLGRFTAELEVDELDVVEVALGQEVTLAIDALPALDVRGTVERVALAPTRDATGGSLYAVGVALDGAPDPELRIGLTAAAEIEVRRLDGDLVVPTSALLRRGGQEVVYRVEDGVAREVPVTVAAIGDIDAAVEGDLEVGDEVVTLGVELIEDGDELPG